jgi:hypothetical protein
MLDRWTSRNPKSILSRREECLSASTRTGILQRGGGTLRGLQVPRGLQHLNDTTSHQYTGLCLRDRMSPAESQGPGPKRQCHPVGPPVPSRSLYPAAPLAALRHSEPTETQGTPGALGPYGSPPARPGEPIPIVNNRARNRRLPSRGSTTSPTLSAPAGAWRSPGGLPDYSGATPRDRSPRRATNKRPVRWRWYECHPRRPYCRTGGAFLDIA